jgi:hypothetical protein
MERFCSPMCKRCAAPGPMLCNASARAEKEDRHFEEVDRVHDEHRAASWSSPNRPEGTYVDTEAELFSTRTWADALDAIGKMR